MKQTENMPISRTRATKAGQDITSFPQTDPKYKEAVKVLREWRRQHLRPTEIAFSCLLKNAKQLKSQFVASFRLKRQESIINKLRRKQAHYKLGELDDIGGCRLIVKNLEDLHKIISIIQADDQLGQKNITKEKDYISKPEKSGYRSYHYLARIHDPSDSSRNYRIEIQIRTFLEHYWATALETFSEISGINLKDPEVLSTIPPEMKQRTENYQRVFTDISQLFAIKEHTALIKDIETNPNAIKEKLLNSIEFKTIYSELSKARNEVKPLTMDKQTKATKLFLLEFSRDDQTINVRSFDAIDSAMIAYDKIENLPFTTTKQEYSSDQPSGTEASPQRPPLDSNTVLAYADSHKNLERAYPNYRLDQHLFLHELDELGLKPLDEVDLNP
jgi:putative GTP pyrophosphokinase